MRFCISFAPIWCARSRPIIIAHHIRRHHGALQIFPLFVHRTTTRIYLYHWVILRASSSARRHIALYKYIYIYETPLFHCTQNKIRHKLMARSREQQLWALKCYFMDAKKSRHGQAFSSPHTHVHPISTPPTLSLASLVSAPWPTASQLYWDMHSAEDYFNFNPPRRVTLHFPPLHVIHFALVDTHTHTHKTPFKPVLMHELTMSHYPK